jgi:hypothetical protein
VPFSIYFPVGWTLDESQAAQGRVYFYAPGVTAPVANAAWVVIEATGTQTPNGTIEALRDQYYRAQVSANYAQAAIDVTRYNRFSGLTFASVGAAYSASGHLCYTYLGVGLQDQGAWRYRINSPYATYDQHLEAAFNPMFASLNIYGNP